MRAVTVTKLVINQRVTINKFIARSDHLLCLLLLLSIGSLIQSAAQISPARDLTRYVDPFIGTAGHGHTFPGATMPFGMVQLSPDTRLTGWDGCSGYHYSDNIIYGFSHTHFERHRHLPLVGALLPEGSSDASITRFTSVHLGDLQTRMS